MRRCEEWSLQAVLLIERKDLHGIDSDRLSSDQNGRGQEFDVESRYASKMPKLQVGKDRAEQERVL